MKIHLPYASIVFATVLCSASQSQATIVVPTGQPTIQAAINAAIPGEDLLVLSGTYLEGQINVTKSVHLSGPNVSVTPPSPRTAEARVVGGFEVMASDVSIQGFEIVEGVPHPNAATLSRFVWSSQAFNGIDVSFNWIHGPAGQSASAIELGDQNSGLRSALLTVGSNTINGLVPGSSSGIFLTAVDGATVVGNLVHLATVPTSSGDYGLPGIVFDGVHDGLIAKNDLDLGQSNANIGSAAYGIGVQAFFDDILNVSISQNIVRNSVAGVLSSSASFAVRNLAIVKNRVEATMFGIRLQGFNIGTNAVSHESVSVNQNDIVAAGSCADVLGTPGTGRTVSDVIFRKNCFEAAVGAVGVFGVRVAPTTPIPTHGGLVDARMNYWGSSNGPSSVGTGSGVGVTNRVDFRKWLENCPN